MVRATPQSQVALPLTHVTSGYYFRDIIETQTLAPTFCRVFSEDLLYMFYGRPAYRAASEQEGSGLDAYWPICIVLNHDALLAPTRIFPFDSGAFHQRRFDRFMHHEMIKEDFELDPDPSMPGRLLRLFWRDEKSYYNAKGLADFEPQTFHFEAKAYHRLIGNLDRAPFDERNSAIEVQLGSPVELAGNTLAVILPEDFSTPERLQRIEGIGALALPFPTVGRHGPREMVGQIYDIVRDLLGGKHGRVKCW
jgi:hypothetical protein